MRVPFGGGPIDALNFRFSLATLNREIHVGVVLYQILGIDIRKRLTLPLPSSLVAWGSDGASLSPSQHVYPVKDPVAMRGSGADIALCVTTFHTRLAGTCA